MVKLKDNYDKKIELSILYDFIQKKEKILNIIWQIRKRQFLIN